MSAATYNGKVCAKHPELLGKRYASGSCVKCSGENSKVYAQKNAAALAKYRAEYYKKNTEKLLAQCADRYAKDSDRIKAATRAYSIANKDKNKVWQKTYRDANRDLCNARVREHRRANPEIGVVYGKQYRLLNAARCKKYAHEYGKKNRHEKNARWSAYRAKKLQATPAWANDFFISEAYHLAKLREKVCGGKWHVDHIVPLVSDVVCGLHWEQNLQVIPAAHNVSKSNRHWPNMP